MAFPVSPTNGQVTVVNQVSYQYSSATNSWTRILSTANVITANTIAVNGALTVGTTISAAGNITGSYYFGNGSQLTGVSASTSGFPVSAGNSNIAASPNANIAISVGGTSNVAVFATTGEYITGVLSASGTITGGNLATAGTASATGNITGGNVLTGGLISATSTITSAANITGGNVLTGGLVSATATITGGNLATGGTASATGNITGGNVLTGGLVSATGNVTGGNLITAGNVFAPAIIANSSTYDTRVSLNSAAGIIEITSNANSTQFTPSGIINLSGASQIKGGTFSGSYLTLGASQTDLAQDRGGNVTVQVGTGGTINSTWTFTNSGNLLAPGAVSAVGNVTGGNVLTGGLVSATGNVTGNYILGNGALLTGVITSVANINNGTSNVTVVSSGGNVTVGIGGTANVAVFATTGEYITGELSASGNVTGGNVLTGGLISATSTITSAANITGGNLLTGGLVSATANVTGGNLLTGGLASIAGNVTGGNVLTAGLISATSTITSAANITGGNVLTGGLVSATANVTGGNLLTGGLASIAGNVTGGNLLTAGLISATGNIQGANVNTNQIRNVSGALTIGVTGGNLLLQPSGNVVLSANTYINNLASPFASSDAATKEYVDNLATTAIAYHQAVYVATTTTLATTTGGAITYAQPNGVANGIGATITTTGTFDLIDTANVQSANTRILVKNEANAAHNGVYTWSNATVITRSTDTDQYGANSAEEFSINDYFFVQSGNVNAGSAYIVDSPTGTITFGTSNIAFAQFSSSQVYTANTAAGISLNGTVINAKTDGVTTAFDGGGNIIVKASANLTTPNIGAATGTSLNTTGNVTGGNLLTGGLISATSTITSAANITGGNVLTGGLISATSTITSAANITGGNVLTGGLVSATANVTGGNLLSGGLASVTGNVTGGNILTAGLISATSTITSSANITGGNVLTGGLVSATANVTGGNLLTAGLISATSTITSAANITGGNVLTGGLVSATGNVTGNYILGNGALLTGVITSVANINNGTSNVTVVSSGGNITVGVGGTGNVAVFATTGEYVNGLISASGNITGGNVLTGGVVSATANVTGGNLLTAGLISATSTITSAANITGGNILTGGLVSATANVTGGNLLTAGIISATGNIRGGNVSATNYYYANGVAIINYTASTTPPASPSTGWQWYNTSTDVLYEYITDGTTPYWVDISSPAFSNGPAGNMSIGGSLLPSANITYDLGSTTNRWKDLWLAGTTLYLGDAVLSASGTSVSLGTGNVTGGNVTTAGIVSATGNIIGNYIFGNGSQLTGVDATQIINGTSNAKVSGSGGNIAVTIGGTANVAVFTTAGMTITGNIENGGSNGTGNIGSATTYFNTIFGKATTAQYADLAENYQADAAYVPGTVLDFDGEQEVTISTRDSSKKVAGVVSTNPAHLMNSTLGGAHVVAVALVGRVPTQVTGKIVKGDLMVSAGNGRAKAEANPAIGTVIGKALENFSGGEGTIEIVICMQ